MPPATKKRKRAFAKFKAGTLVKVETKAKRSTPRVPLWLRPHSFVERSASPELLQLVAGDTGIFGRTFQLDQIGQILSYNKLFELYRIMGVVVTFRWKAAGNTVQSSDRNFGNELNPILWYKKETNDVTDTIAGMKLSMQTREHQFSNDKPNFSILIKPNTLTEVYKSSIASTYVPKRGQWLNMADTTVPHYGVKFFIESPAVNGTTVSQGYMKVEYKYYFECKGND